MRRTPIKTGDPVIDKALLSLQDGINSITNASAYNFGPPSNDGTWRIIRVGDNLEVQYRQSGAWVVAYTFTRNT